LLRSVSLAGEAERKIVREIVRRARDPVKARLVPPEIVAKYRAKLEVLEEDVKRVMEEEQAEREIARLENRANRLQNTLDGDGGSQERDRTWFQTKKERLDEQKRLKKEAPAASVTLTKKKKKKAAAAASSADPREVAARRQQDRDAAFVVRQAKRSRKQKRIRAVVDGDERRTGAGGKSAKKRKPSSFDTDFGNGSKRAKFTQNKKKPSFRNKKF
jgi:ATP-dependent RNA helicase DDX27